MSESARPVPHKRKVRTAFSKRRRHGDKGDVETFEAVWERSREVAARGQGIG